MISEIRTLVSPQTALAQSTHVTEDFGYMTRAGEPVVFQDQSIVMVPLLPVNNMHIESRLGVHVVGENNLHLEFWQDEVPAGINVANAKRFNNWSREEQSWTHANDGTFPLAAVPYPVARGAIGRFKDILHTDDGEYWYAWDGRVPYAYDESDRIYKPVPQRFALRVVSGGGPTNVSLRERRGFASPPGNARDRWAKEDVQPQ